MSKLKKAASLTDIHFGCKNNSAQHNEDCVNYLTWFCNIVRKDPSIDHIIFLGDWFENRSALNISTLHYSYIGAKMLNDLDIPVFFVIGNHDLYHKHTREIYSTVHFNEFDNFRIIIEPTVITEIETTPLICPYLFPHEYGELFQYNKLATWWGHFEFQGFVITGYNVKMPTGPNPKDFTGPKYIFSGHFHKRQRSGNIVYIGNTFPTNFGDASDTDRGMMVYDHLSQQLDFYNWTQCPQYVKTNISTILDDDIVLPMHSRVKCLLDVPLTYEEQTGLKYSLIETYKLREFTFVDDVVDDSQSDIEQDDVEQIESVDETVVRLLSGIDMPSINNDTLIQLYWKL